MKQARLILGTTMPGLGRHALLGAAILVAPIAVGCRDGGSGTPDPQSGAARGNDELHVVTGALPLYHLQTKLRNDASGAVFLPGTNQVLLVDDGGDEPMPDTMPLYLTDVAGLFGEMPAVSRLPLNAEELAGSLPARHKDLEAATADERFIYIASSLPFEGETNKSDPAYRQFSRFRLENGRIVDDRTIELRTPVMQALSQATSDPWFGDWLERWSVRKPNSKDCGLNVEALTRTPQPDELLIGLRSPHYGPDYCQFDDQTKNPPQTRNGAAILVKINVADFQTENLGAAVHATLDLGGLGFRGMEYSPTARGYFITAGAVEAGFDYDFFFWNGVTDTPPLRLSTLIPEFAKLCRPESVAEIVYQGRAYLLVLSEESGGICETPPAPYNYLLIELNRGFLKLLR